MSPNLRVHDQKNRQQLISPQPAQDCFVNLGSTGPTTNPVFFVTRPFFNQLVSTPQQFPVRREAIDQRPQTLGHLCHLEGHPLVWGWMLVPMDVAAARIRHVFLLAAFVWCVFVGGKGHVANDRKLSGDKTFPWKNDTTLAPRLLRQQVSAAKLGIDMLLH